MVITLAWSPSLVAADATWQEPGRLSPGTDALYMEDIQTGFAFSSDFFRGIPGSLILLTVFLIFSIEKSYW